MSLDIEVKEQKTVICPHCNGVVGTEDVECGWSCGRGWYDILKRLGYYVPYDKRTDQNDWYGKDMTLTPEQTKLLFDFVNQNRDLYNADSILNLIVATTIKGNAVVINADW